MSVSLSNAFVTLFDAEVKQAYQAKAMLVGAVRQRRGVEGSTVKFPKVGKGVATARITQTDVTPMNVGFSSVTCTLQDWNAAEYSDIFSQQKVNFDERQELVQVVASAMGRRQDQLILDALGSSGTSLTVANSIGGSNTNMNLAKLREAKRLLDKNNGTGTISINAQGGNTIDLASSKQFQPNESAMIVCSYSYGMVHVFTICTPLQVFYAIVSFYTVLIVISITPPNPSNLLSGGVIRVNEICSITT